MEFVVFYGAGKSEGGFTTKDAAITWARSRELDSFEVYDDDDYVVYQEYPQAKFI